MSESPVAIIISVSSDIGYSLACRLLSKGWGVVSTYRTKTSQMEDLEARGSTLIKLDLSDKRNIDTAADQLGVHCPEWDLLSFCAGTLDPIGPFIECDFDEWENAISVNFVRQLRLMHRLLPGRKTGSQVAPSVIFFAGGGTNSAPVNFSSYVVSKLAMIKMCELLDVEVPDTKFAILGPGWVDTKIHQQTLSARERAGAEFGRTLKKIKSGDSTPMERVLDCVEWIISSPQERVGGRNFSVVHDCWGSADLDSLLALEPHMYKLRRYGNSFLVAEEKPQRQPVTVEQQAENEPVSVLDRLFELLPVISRDHAPGSRQFAFYAQAARDSIELMFANERSVSRRFGPFGGLTFPYHKMGAVDSLNLFDLNELIIFCYYWQSRNRYNRVADLGANIGLHSIIMSRCGFAVRAYEPDPAHFEVLERNLRLNSVKSVQSFNTAVSTTCGQREFVRVLGNTTGSHLCGAKSNPYGDLERFSVAAEELAPILEWADLLKIDVEGHEKELIAATKQADWLGTDALVEVGTQGNAEHIFEHLSSIGVNMFSQKIGWRKVGQMSDMPNSYRDGTLFITLSENMPWSES